MSCAQNTIIEKSQREAMKKIKNKFIEENRKMLEDFPQIKEEPKYYDSVIHLICSECGAYCSWPVAKFFSFEPEKILCYKCQEKKSIKNY